MSGDTHNAPASGGRLPRMSIETVNQVFYQVVDRQLDRVMLYKQTVKWIPISSRELYRDAVGIARALAGWGIAKGDRVAILSENRPEWATAEFGTLLIGRRHRPHLPDADLRAGGLHARRLRRTRRLCFHRGPAQETPGRAVPSPSWKKLWSWTTSEPPTRFPCTA